jgi:ATP-binding cassette subfamily B multidrug efflux pump
LSSGPVRTVRGYLEHLLLPLLRTYLAPCKRPIAIVLFFQLVQTLADLYLPGLNADIIDRGVVVGGTGFIVRTGLVMLAITALQVVCTIVAVYYGARTAMALGRDLRAACSARSRRSRPARWPSWVPRR